jgi:hypothetical protein
MPAVTEEVLAFLRTQPFGTKIVGVYVDLAMRHFGHFGMTHLGRVIRAPRKAEKIVTNPIALERDTFIAFAGPHGASTVAKHA